jgi:hypothetical protein
MKRRDLVRHMAVTLIEKARIILSIAIPRMANAQPFLDVVKLEKRRRELSAIRLAFPVFKPCY